ncbi:DUF418 domain-containing protein [Desulfuribacillus alkaliarsenatis]|uniref:DUF418 domain-containing protein n=1 Tax=Desulfuribacillus alkaliarsenatis TaxID=766136 RepID=A0A1E5G0U8_9FIRM|nr:DUF418 domain-containing protein [Desulfuribacillus alkaliarsenatis]OEF96373.1 hypothetical protein BHF68_09010 [Desulfuribacillus alkaliarsenatis]
MEQLTPIEANRRIASLDILRGFALLGILMVNMIYFNTPIVYYYVIGEIPWESPLDRWAYYGIQLLAEGKFYTMFSFLFGVGFVIFMERAQEKHKKAGLLFARRLFFLLLFGLIHAFFFWYGDILIMYALIGFLLLAFFNRKPKTMLVWAITLLILSIVIMGLLFIASMAYANMDMAEYNAQNQMFLAQMYEQIESSYFAYSEGSYADIMQQRITDLSFVFTYAIFGVPMILPMFLMGAYVGKRKIISNVSVNLGLIKKIWLWSLIFGLPMTIMKVYSQAQASFELITVYNFTNQVGMVIGDPALSIFYMTSILLLLQKETWQRLLRPFASVGRMALSNYILQTLICTTIFYSYGLGMYGNVGPAVGILIAIAIYITQVKLSVIWFNKYKYGPLEWIWRWLTYGNVIRQK